MMIYSHNNCKYFSFSTSGETWPLVPVIFRFDRENQFSNSTRLFKHIEFTRGLVDLRIHLASIRPHCLSQSAILFPLQPQVDVLFTLINNESISFHGYLTIEIALRDIIIGSNMVYFLSFL